jgi:rhodanese-related sulfurtransferase
MTTRIQGVAVTIPEFVSNNIWLVAAAVISGGYVVWPWVSRSTSGLQELGAMEAVQRMNRKDAIVLDVREQKEFDAGRISGAKHFPLASLDKRSDDLRKFVKKPVLVVCATGTRSRAACAALKKKGFEDVALLAGGMGAWQQAGLPVGKS